jgi:4-hydroxy-tetrahydrodipicolinate synthase
MKLSGTMTALVTPFRDGALDEEALKALIDFQLSEGIDGIVPCGSTGEAATLSYEEHERVMALTAKWVQGKVPVIPGTGSNSTKETIEITEMAKKAGCDMALVVGPYYNKPTQEGMYRHFTKVAEEVDIPLVIYNMPGRTGVNILPELVARLAQIPNIVAIKESSGSIPQVAEIYRLTRGEFPILSGDDNLFLPMMAVGATGVISVLSNVMPRQVKTLGDAFLKEGNFKKALSIHMELLPIFNGIFVETNPIPIKEVLFLAGRINDPELRLPLTPLSDQNKEFIKQLVRDYGLIK